jgi:hypothetical protein
MSRRTARPRPFAKDNVPYRPKAHLKIASQGVKDGDFVMVAGFPGTTSRLVTAAEARFNFDTMLPAQQKLLNDYSELIKARTDSNPDAKIKYASILQGADNYKKKNLGEMAGADRIGLAARKAAIEADYRAWIAADAKRVREYDPARLDGLVTQANQAALDTMRMGTLSRAQLLSAARNMYRWSKERAKPDAQRESGYQDRDRLPTEQRLTSIERRYVPTVDRAAFEQALTEYQKVDAAKRDAAFAAKLREIGMDRLYADTKLGTPRRDLPGSTNRRPSSRHRPIHSSSLPSPCTRPTSPASARPRSAPAGSRRRDRPICVGCSPMRKRPGKALYPDANGSLRFTHGKVTGKDC